MLTSTLFKGEGKGIIFLQMARIVDMPQNQQRRSAKKKKTVKNSLSIEISARTTLLRKLCGMSTISLKIY